MISIGKGYEIGSDGLNITVYRSEGPKKTLKVKGYFSSVKNALDWLVDNEIMATGLKDIETVVAKIEELHQFIAELPLKGVEL